MCLIAVKPRGVKLPSDLDMADWFTYHKDGFGLSFQHKGKVQILKGAMTLKEMFEILNTMYRMIGSEEAVKNTNIMYHFRQTSGGTVCAANCHPFPISKNKFILGSKRIRVSAALAHNGIIDAYSSYSYTHKSYIEMEKTDTQKFIETDLVPLGERLYDKDVLEMISSLTESRYALMLPNRVILAGGFVTDDGGMLYSNKQYEWARNYGKYNKVIGYYDVDEDYCYNPQLQSPKTEADIIAESLKELDSGFACDTCEEETCSGCTKYKDGSFRCDLCDQPADSLYLNDNATICRDCFITINGYSPIERDKYI